MGSDHALPRSTSAGWGFDHLPIGTCSRRCPSYERCHCGCGERPKRSAITFRGGHRVEGEPFVFRSGHHARVFPRRAGYWSRRGIPVERVRPLLRWLHERHGTWETVAGMLDIPISTVKGYANNRRRRRVPPESARRIQKLVMLHRRRGGWLDQWETEPGEIAR